MKPKTVTIYNAKENPPPFGRHVYMIFTDPIGGDVGRRVEDDGWVFANGSPAATPVYWAELTDIYGNNGYEARYNKEEK